MIERIVYGPIEYLAPDTALTASLEIRGIRIPDCTFTTHVFLEEVKGGPIDTLIKTANYAGRFTVPNDATSEAGQKGSVQIDISQALKRAEELRPNFHITFLTEKPETAGDEPLFQFESIHIYHDAPLYTELDISANVMGGLVARRNS